MARIKILICLLIAFFAVKTEVNAQQDTTIHGMKWFLKKTVALDSARLQGKQVFLLWGRFDCPDCQWVKERLSESPFKSIVEENYILWFSSSREYALDSEEIGDYLSFLKDEARVYIPTICIIDPSDATVAQGYIAGPDFSLKDDRYQYKTAQYYNELLAVLEDHVSNDFIVGKGANGRAYVIENNLVIKSEAEGEIISIFSMNGSLVDSFRKAGYDISRNLSEYPKGVLIVTGSSGWKQKILIK